MTVKAVYERASILDVDVPPRNLWWDSERLDKYFEEAKKDD